MINDRVKEWLRIGADVTVVVGIILVVVQLRQNTNAVIAANSTAVTDQSLVFFQVGLDNQVTARAIQKVEAKEELSALERSQYSAASIPQLSGF